MLITYIFLGYADKNEGKRYSALSEVYIEMYNDMASDFDSAPNSARNCSSFVDKKWW
jgi:hypothetical protein